MKVLIACEFSGIVRLSGPQLAPGIAEAMADQWGSL